MDFTTTRALNTLFSLINKTVRNIIEYNMQHSDFPLSPERVEQYVTKRLLVNIIWAFSGDGKLDFRAEMGDFLRKQTGIDLPPLTQGGSLLDYDVQINNGEWSAWQSNVPVIEMSLMRSLLPMSLFLPWTPSAMKKFCPHGSPNTNLSCFVVPPVPARP